MSKIIEKATKKLIEIRGEKYVKNNPFTSKEEAEDYILAKESLYLLSRTSDHNNWLK